MRAYRLLKDGQMVYTFRSTVVTPDGRQEHLTRGDVGRAGQVFTTLAQFVVDDIEEGTQDDVWEVIDLPDPDAVEESAPSAPVEPEVQGTQDDVGGSASARSSRRGRAKTGTEE